MSDWRTPPPSGAFPAPSEGLPPCVKGLAVFENNQASWHDMTKCHEPRSVSKHHIVLAGQRFHGPHDGCTKAILDYLVPTVLDCCTDDADEAQAAFERGAEWVRTGEMA